MVGQKPKKKTFSGMSYGEVQRSNSNRRGKLPQKEQQWLKENGYRNVGWDNVIRLYQKINELLVSFDTDELSLEELFLKADKIGQKYQTPEEIAAFQEQLAAEVQLISDEVDRQFPDSEVESIDYSKFSYSAAKRKKKQKKYR
ncbi:MAG TPA: hypothetical protein V6D29_22585 [Leptolyngbyaceae cyanobacterium]